MTRIVTLYVKCQKTCQHQLEQSFPDGQEVSLEEVVEKVVRLPRRRADLHLAMPRFALQSNSVAFSTRIIINIGTL